MPGGLGVFDGAMLLALGPYMPAPQILGMVLIFRLFYYIIPLFLAGIMFAGHELFLRGDAALAEKKNRKIQNNPDAAAAPAPAQRRPSQVVRESEAAFLWPWQRARFHFAGYADLSGDAGPRAQICHGARKPADNGPCGRQLCAFPYGCCAYQLGYWAFPAGYAGMAWRAVSAAYRNCADVFAR